MAHPKNNFLRRCRKPVFSVVFLVAVVGIFSAFTLFRTLDFVEQKLVDLRFNFFNQQKPVSPDIVFVDITEESLQSLSPVVGGWPWLRSGRCAAVR